MNTLGMGILAVVLMTVLFAPKRWALLGMATGVLYLTQAIQFEFGGLNLYAVRIVEVAAFFRVVVRREFSFAAMTRLDRLLVVLYVYTVGVFLLRSSEDQVYQIGTGVDALLSYFAFRGFLSDDMDFKWFLRGMTVLLIPYAVLVTMETVTTSNPFASIGGIELNRAGDRWFRDGRMRATGSFGHPSLMGTLGGTFLPLFIGAWLANKDRLTASVGIAMCMVVVWASNSGGPATCVVATIAGWALWTMRANMRWVRRGSVVFIALLALAMKAPIWYLLARISNITGGDGYHRSALLDVAFQNIDKWWLSGMRLLDTSRWLPYTNTNTGAVDMTNNFLVFGITAGLGSMLLLMMLLTVGFKVLGEALAIVRSRGERHLEYVLWGLGVTLGVHLFNWFGITYWDQSNLLWFMHLAFIASLTDSIIRATPPVTAAAPAATPGSAYGSQRAVRTNPFLANARSTKWRTSSREGVGLKRLRFRG